MSELKFLDLEGIRQIRAHITEDLFTKVDKEDGKELSSNDYTDEEKEKLAELENYILPVATSSALGGVKSGTDITIDSSGNVSVVNNSHTHSNSTITSLDASKLTGTVPTSVLPSYVDDVIEATSTSGFPLTGETGKIYVDTSSNKTYRWSGSQYTEISASLALGTTSSTAYRGDRGAAAYAHAVTNKGVAKSSGLYKITTNSEGHVTAGTAVTKADITGLGIPAQDTTYSNMTAATSSAAGKAGLVPAPAAGKQSSFLRGDGTWATPTNTKNTAGSTNTSSKIFLVGATSQAANPQTYSHDTAYVGTDGYLYSNSEKVWPRIYSTLVPYGTQIPENADLNTVDYLRVGNYYCSQNVIVKTLKNCPLTTYGSDGVGISGNAFMMQVYSPLSPILDNETTGTHIYRLRKIIHYNTGVEYTQYCSVSSTAGADNWTYGNWHINPRSLFTFNKTSASTAAVGSATHPVYVDSTGTITKTTYTLGKSVPSDAKFTDTTYSAATTSANGLMTSTMVTKLNGIATGAEVNQNAFSNVIVGSTTIAADSKTDSLTLAAGSNVTITPDATNDKITIAATDTTYSAGTGISLSGTTINHKNSVTAGTAQGSASKTLTFGGTFTIPTITYDAQGHVTGKGTTTMTMPSNPNVDTKVNVTLGTTTKAYLLGVSTTPTSTAQALTAISDTGVYLDTTAGKLTAGSFAGNGANLTNLNASNISSGTIAAARLPVASTSAQGAMTAAMVTKLNGIANSADAVSFTSNLTSGEKIGTININGTNTDIFVPESGNMYGIHDGEGNVTLMIGDAENTATTITPETIGAADRNHTHNAMTGATTSKAGTSGFVPAPAAGAANRFLRADGTWQEVTIPEGGGTVSGNYLPLSGGTVTGNVAITATTASTSTTTGALKVSGGVGIAGDVYANAVVGAVWNDYAETRKAYSEDFKYMKPGCVVTECAVENDTVRLTDKRLEKIPMVITDTYGFLIGEKEGNVVPVAVAGRVLVNTYEDRSKFELGDAVCSGPNGTVSIMTYEELLTFPDRVLGYVSCIPDYDTWGEVKVNNRIWIKLK